jgi:uncharacterized Zn finger protein (UPF0148 family)
MQLGRTQQYGMELKYCERCGTLGLRRGGSDEVYCPACEVAMSQVFQAPLHRHRIKPTRRGDQHEESGPISPDTTSFHGVAGRCL